MSVKSSSRVQDSDSPSPLSLGGIVFVVVVVVVGTIFGVFGFTVGLTSLVVPTGDAVDYDTGSDQTQRL